jgi:hypothetical protein
MSEPTKIYCVTCKKETFVKPNGDCPGCGRLVTMFPERHMESEQIRLRQQLHELVELIREAPDEATRAWLSRRKHQVMNASHN